MTLLHFLRFFDDQPKHMQFALIGHLLRTYCDQYNLDYEIQLKELLLVHNEVVKKLQEVADF